MTFIAGHTAVENTQLLARSALPDAPVVNDGRSGERVRPHPPPTRLSVALRTTARWQLRLAERVDRRRYQPQTH
jgi:hypothetical protein